MLALDKVAEDDNHDDVDGDTQTVCTAAVTYEQTSAGLRAVAAQTRCEENGKFMPPVKTQRFACEPAKKRFEEVK